MGRILIIIASLCLVACGNPDLGKPVRSTGKSTSSLATPATGLSNGSFGSCQNFTVYAGTDAGFAQNLSGANICVSTTQLNLVRLKVSANYPTGTRACLVPLSFQGAYNATCFNINGQLEVSLATDQFTSVALVRESDLGAYTTYLAGQSASYPAMAYASLR